MTSLFGDWRSSCTPSTLLTLLLSLQFTSGTYTTTEDPTSCFVFHMVKISLWLFDFFLDLATSTFVNPFPLTMIHPIMIKWSTIMPHCRCTSIFSLYIAANCFRASPACFVVSGVLFSCGIWAGNFSSWLTSFMACQPWRLMMFWGNFQHCCLVTYTIQGWQV